MIVVYHSPFGTNHQDMLPGDELKHREAGRFATVEDAVDWIDNQTQPIDYYLTWPSDDLTLQPRWIV